MAIDRRKVQKLTNAVTVDAVQLNSLISFYAALIPEWNKTYHPLIGLQEKIRSEQFNKIEPHEEQVLNVLLKTVANTAKNAMLAEPCFVHIYDLIAAKEVTKVTEVKTDVIASTLSVETSTKSNKAKSV